MIIKKIDVYFLYYYRMIFLLLLIGFCQAATLAQIPLDANNPCEMVGIKPGDWVVIHEDLTLESALYYTSSLVWQTKLLLSKTSVDIGGPFAIGAIPLVCHTFLPKAYIPALPTPLPIYMCYNTCVWSSEKQYAYLASLLNGYGVNFLGVGIYKPNDTENTTPMNCSRWTTHYPSRMPFFTNYNYTINNVTYQVPCVDIPTLTLEDILIYGCPYPLVSVNKVGCAYGGTPPPMTGEQYDNISILSLCIGSFGLLLCLIFLAFSLVDHKSYYSYPGYFVIIAVIYCSIGCLSFMGSYMVGVDKIWGDQYFEFSTQNFNIDRYGAFEYFVDTSDFIVSNALCTMQGFGIYVSFLGSITITPQITFAILISLYPKYKQRIDLFLNEKIFRNRYFKSEYLWNFTNIIHVVILLVSVILASTDNFVLGPGAGYCGINPQDLDMLIPFWVVPLVCMPIFALIMAIGIVSTLLWHWTHTTNWTQKSNYISSGFRLYLVSSSIVIVGIACAICSIIAAVETQEASDQISDYINCILNISRNRNGCALPDNIYIINMVYITFMVCLFVTYPTFGLIGFIIKFVTRTTKIVSSSKEERTLSGGGSLEIVEEEMTEENRGKKMLEEISSSDEDDYSSSM
jgi:hypothetical protein